MTEALNSQHLKHFTINKNQREKVPYDDYPDDREILNRKFNTRNGYTFITRNYMQQLNILAQSFKNFKDRFLEIVVT